MAKEANNTEIKHRRKGRSQTNPNSLANLIPFQKGTSGNPEGKPIGALNVSTIMIELLQQIAPQMIIDTKFVKEFCRENKQVTNAHATVCRILYEGIVKGESWALKEISDRTEGRAKQSVALTGEDGEDLFKNITVKIIDGTRDRNE